MSDCSPANGPPIGNVLTSSDHSLPQVALDLVWPSSRLGFPGQVWFLQHGHTSRVCFQKLPGVVLIDWTCHEDPHPGNLAVDDKYPGGRLIFYDFGQAQPVKAQGLDAPYRPSRLKPE